MEKPFSIQEQSPARSKTGNGFKMTATDLAASQQAMSQGASQSVEGGEEAQRRHKVLFEWNRTDKEFPEQSCAHQLIEAQTAKTPDAPAVIFEKQVLKYAELDRQATALAGSLQSLGVGPNEIVGIHLPRSAEALISVLAVLKAGGAYLPMDPSYPADRLRFMAEDARLKAILTWDALGQPTTLPENRILVPDQVLPELIRNTPPPALKTNVQPEHLAYVMYTSGSTGKPKGVQIHHRGLVNFLCAMQQKPGITAADTILAVTTLSFDISGLDLLLPLTVGGRVAIMSRKASLDPEAIAIAIDRHQATVLQTTPTRWRMLIDAGWPGRKGLRCLCGGEAMSRELANMLLDRCDEVWNLYGPTETTVWCSLQKVERGTGVVSVGRPIANMQMYILNSEFQPAPVGEVGELFIGGVGVAQGYLNRPDLNTERFIPDPFRAGSGNRLYRTGDNARYLLDGQIDFLGRMDDQVKIRGFRIELGEVEAALAQHPQVLKCVILAVEMAGRGKSLAAYFIPRYPQSVPTVFELRDFVGRKLPDYMVPAAFVSLTAFPLNANGKVDRRALPPPDSQLAIGSECLAPRNTLERELSEIWQNLLLIPQVGIRDNFFELGGDSLLAARLINRVNSMFNIDLDVMKLFENPTIEQLAAVFQEQGRTSQQPSLFCLQADGSGLPVYFVWRNLAVESLRLMCLNKMRQPFFVSDAPYSSELLMASARGEAERFPSIEELAVPHTQLIRASIGSGPCIIAGYSYGGVLAFEVARQLLHQKTPVPAVLLFSADMPPSPWTQFTLWGQRQFQELCRQRTGWFRRKLRRFIEHRQPKEDSGSAVNRIPLPSLESLRFASPLERWRLIEPIWRHQMKKYRPQRMATRCILFRSREEVFFGDQNYDGCLGWRKLFTGGVKVLMVPGDHLSMWREPHVHEVRRCWDACLEELQQSMLK